MIQTSNKDPTKSETHREGCVCGMGQGGALTPMELAPGLPFAAGMIDSP
jgi:hypothetical protein